MLRLVAIFFAISFVHVDGQIPKPCANDGNLARECCPTLFLPDQTSAGPCGEDLDRGKCDILNLPFVENEDDERKNWPIQLFERVCNCSGNYDGYDCGECKFGYTGEDCNTPKPRQMRQSLDTLTSESWSTYLEGLRMAKTTKSRYWVLTQDSTLVNPTIYDLFIWIHHFSAKDNPILNRDYAHESTGFLTWHRFFLLWFEREVQRIYPEFRIYYWDWSDNANRETPFMRDRLGESKYMEIDGTFAWYVVGDLFDNDTWPTYCWENTSNIPVDMKIDKCNPVISSNQSLRRCPDPTYCNKDHVNWPSEEDVQKALSIEIYDSPPYNENIKSIDDSFRNYLEGFEEVDTDNCEYENLCSKDIKRKLHNTVHIILGLGRLYDDDDDEKPKFNKQGAMWDVAASPNDPIFINHHAMIDCIFEEWISNHPNVQYPTDRQDKIHDGHKADDYIVPFIPLYKHKEMFKTADNFGYSCTLKRIKPTEEPTETTGATTTKSNRSSTLKVSLSLFLCLLIVIF